MDFMNMLGSEIKSVYNLVYYNFEAIFRGELKKKWEKNRPTAILLHGYLVGTPSLRGLEKYLQKNSFNAHCEPYAFWDDLKKVKTAIKEDLDDICQKVSNKLSIVGHSEGGLLAYSLAQDCPELIERVIALGTPFRGTLVAYLNFFVASASQMI